MLEKCTINARKARFTRTESILRSREKKEKYQTREASRPCAIGLTRARAKSYGAHPIIRQTRRIRGSMCNFSSPPLSSRKRWRCQSVYLGLVNDAGVAWKSKQITRNSSNKRNLYCLVPILCCFGCFLVDSFQKETKQLSEKPKNFRKIISVTDLKAMNFFYNAKIKIPFYSVILCLNI